MANPAVEAVGHEGTLRGMDPIPAIGDDDKPTEHEQIAHEMDGRHHSGPTTEQDYPEVAAGV